MKEISLLINNLTLTFTSKALEFQYLQQRLKSNFFQVVFLNSFLIAISIILLFLQLFSKSMNLHLLVTSQIVMVLSGLQLIKYSSCVKVRFILPFIMSIVINLLVKFKIKDLKNDNTELNQNENIQDAFYLGLFQMSIIALLSSSMVCRYSYKVIYWIANLSLIHI
eukprot:TRINITY_DN3974_c0_g1_i3.p1 TRINITY_DN3974_c0_g1~~TRINITY_DN3974_c0_g1_i3.p1  ORF type:complete len:166 (+),score=12.37 TRINITY_DN3974_c0_g1_i3:89-586(+)